MGLVSEPQIITLGSIKVKILFLFLFYFNSEVNWSHFALWDLNKRDSIPPLLPKLSYRNWRPFPWLLQVSKFSVFLTTSGSWFAHVGLLWLTLALPHLDLLLFLLYMVQRWSTAPSFWFPSKSPAHLYCWFEMRLTLQECKYVRVEYWMSVSQKPCPHWSPLSVGALLQPPYPDTHTNLPLHLCFSGSWTSSQILQGSSVSPLYYSEPGRVTRYCFWFSFWTYKDSYKD